MTGNVGSTTVTNVGTVNGNVGGTTLTNSGFVSGNLWGTTVTNSGTCKGEVIIGINTEVPQAQTDYATAYSNVSGRTANVTLSSELGGTILGCGIYASTATFTINDTLTLTGTESDIFIFQMASTLTTGVGSKIILTGGAIASNVYWQVGSSATIDGDFKGNILALTAITQNANATIDGSIFTRDAAIEVHGTSVLPVELTSFTALLNNNSVELIWNTATEVNNYGFEIELKVGSGQSSVSNYEKIGFVNGNGTSNSPKDYSYEDKNVISGKYAYRLKQIDNNGQFEYSKSIEVSFTKQIEFSLEQNYPNPFNPTTKISFNLPEAGIVKLILYNLLGQEIKTLFNEFTESGLHIVNVSANELNRGIYFYKIEAGSFTQARKMTLMK